MGLRRLGGDDVPAHRRYGRPERAVDARRVEIRITGIVKNIGTTAFRADPQDATCMLLENGRMVDSKPIENLAPGETIRLSYERDWCTTTEIPMDYELKIH